MKSNCLICTEDINETITLPCRHVYCRICFKTWYINNKPNCCYCTQSFNLTKYLKLNYAEMNEQQVALVIDKAIEEFDKNILKEIIEERKDTTYPMDQACKNGKLEVIQYLHSIDAKWSVFAMYYACLSNYYQVVKFLIENKDIQDCKLSMLCASASGNIEIVKLLYENGMEFTSDCIYLAYMNNHHKVVEFLNSISNI